METRNGLIIVSGCPRSGTSVCMDIQRAAHGDDKILGHKFPQQHRQNQIEEVKKKLEKESTGEHQVRLYLIEKQLEKQKKNERPEDKYKDMNPEGFWEMDFSVQGIIYQPKYKDILHNARSGDDYRICKVVSQGLLSSDPTYIGKIIYMIRHPRAVAKSQERLVRGFNFTDSQTGEVKNVFEGMKIHTPEMFITVTSQAARFFINNPDVPVRFYHFEKIVSDPLPILKDMQKFVGVGDYDKAKDIVQPKLNRSMHEDIENELWEDAEVIYEKFVTAASYSNHGNQEEALVIYQEILDYMSDPKRQINRTNNKWYCHRAKRPTFEKLCTQCMNNPIVRENFKMHAESVQGEGSHWSDEPCVFECGMDVDREEYVSIDDSIINNFWR